MINFTIGPVQMDEETRKMGVEQIPYFRTPEFSAIMKQNEQLLCKFFDAPEESRVIFMTGSGTASMEGGIMNFFTPADIAASTLQSLSNGLRKVWGVGEKRVKIEVPLRIINKMTTQVL